MSEHFDPGKMAVDLGALRSQEVEPETTPQEVDLELNEADQKLDAHFVALGEQEGTEPKTIERLVEEALGEGLSEAYVEMLTNAMVQFQAACIMASGSRTAVLQLFLRGVALGKVMKAPKTLTDGDYAT